MRKLGLAAFIVLGTTLVLGLLAYCFFHAVPMETALQAFYNLVLPLSVVFGLYQYVARREGEPGLEIDVAQSAARHNDTEAVLVAQVTLRNAGKSLIKPGKGGCVVMIKRFLDSETTNRALPIHQLIAGNADTHEGVLPDMQTDILAPYRSGLHHDSYSTCQLEPGCEHHEIGLFTVNPGSLLLIEVSFSLSTSLAWRGDRVDEFRVFRVPDLNKL